MQFTYDNYEIDIKVKCLYEDEPNTRALKCLITDMMAALCDSAFFHHDQSTKKKAEGDDEQAKAERKYAALVWERFDALHSVYKQLGKEEAEE